MGNFGFVIVGVIALDIFIWVWLIISDKKTLIHYDFLPRTKESLDAEVRNAIVKIDTNNSSHCRYCGAEMAPGSKYCGICGKSQFPKQSKYFSSGHKGTIKQVNQWLAENPNVKNVTMNVELGKGIGAFTYRSVITSIELQYEIDNSNGHRPLLTDTKNYKYCGIGVVTYHGKREWVLVVSNAPVGNTIGSVSGSRTNTRDIRAKVKYFAGGNITIKGLNKKTDTPFEFADYSGNGNSGYSTADFPSLFTYRNNTPGIIDVDGQGRITTKAAGAGSFTVFYRGTIELCTVNVNVKLSYKDMLALTPTPTPKQTETAAPTQPPKQPETAKPTEPLKQTEVPKPTKAPEQAKPTQPPKQPETVKPIAAPKPVQLVKPVSTKFTVKTKNVTYNGKAQKPSVTVYAGNKKISSKYYSVSYKNNKNVGYGTVTVKGKGSYAKYSGSDTFKINLKGVSLSSVKAQKKKMAVYWKKTGGNQGYQVQYSTSKRFSSNIKTVRLSAGKKSVTIKNIPAKKRYYVRIRSYKKVGNKIWYTGWSKVKTVKTK